jgi:hypothetical protein
MEASAFRPYSVPDVVQADRTGWRTGLAQANVTNIHACCAPISLFAMLFAMLYAVRHAVRQMLMLTLTPAVAPFSHRDRSAATHRPCGGCCWLAAHF